MSARDKAGECVELCELAALSGVARIAASMKAAADGDIQDVALQMAMAVVDLKRASKHAEGAKMYAEQACEEEGEG